MRRCRSFRYQLTPTARQRAALEVLLSTQRVLYNAALEERRGAWRWERRSVSYFDQCRTLTELRAVCPETLAWGVVVCRGTLKRLDRAFTSFYRRYRDGETPGYPRFRSAARWESVQWEDASGWKVDSMQGRLQLCGIGAVKLRLHRPIKGTPKAITVAREGRRWFATVRCADVPAEPLPPTGQAIGVDLGIAALMATSDGRLVHEGRHGRAGAQRLAAAQRSLSTKQRGSGRRRRAVERVASAHRRVRNQRNDTLHKLSRSLVDHYDLIVHEDLRIANMVRRPVPRPCGDGSFGTNGALAKAGLNRSIHDAGWGTLLAMIAYKAESAGRTIISVDAHHTSQRCAACGHTAAGNRRTQATFRCLACGHADHADVSAARNILRAGRAQQASACAGSLY